MTMVGPITPLMVGIHGTGVGIPGIGVGDRHGAGTGDHPGAGVGAGVPLGAGVGTILPGVGEARHGDGDMVVLMPIIDPVEDYLITPVQTGHPILAREETITGTTVLMDRDRTQTVTITIPVESSEGLQPIITALMAAPFRHPAIGIMV